MKQNENRLPKITNSDQLQAAIRELEQKKDLQEAELRTHFHEVVSQLEPQNLLRNSIKQYSIGKVLNSGLLQTVAGLGVSYLSGKLIARKSTGSLTNVLRAALQFGVQRLLVAKNGHPKEKDNTESETHHKVKHIARKLLRLFS